MDVDKDARNHIMDMADLLHTFGCGTEACDMELQDTLRAPEVHQLVSQVEASTQNATVRFAQDMYQFVGDKVAKLTEELSTPGTNLQYVQRIKFLRCSYRILRLAIRSRWWMLD